MHAKFTRVNSMYMWEGVIHIRLHKILPMPYFRENQNIFQTLALLTNTNLLIWTALFHDEQKQLSNIIEGGKNSSKYNFYTDIWAAVIGVIKTAPRIEIWLYLYKIKVTVQDYLHTSRLYS